jgi:hypothetical protein
MLCAEISESRMATKAQQVEDGQGGGHRDHQAQEIERRAGAQRPAEHPGRLQPQAGVAAGDALPAREHLFDDEAEGQRRDAEINALDPQRRQAHHHADGGGQRGGAGQRDEERHAVAGEIGLGVCADAQEGRVAQREQAGEAGQQHQAEADDAVDQHEGELGQPVLGKEPGRGDQQQAQRAVPEHVAAVPGQLNVLAVVGLEDETHLLIS